MAVAQLRCHNKCENTTVEVLCKYDIIVIKLASKQIADVFTNPEQNASVIQSTF